ncbi:MAG: UbiH/UbiF family hydroxylase [Burkholderiaceae bacterium]|nr:UbiH/UbiF family hydroxylase [Burkholderiaceae bacterium]MCF8184395.1 UbiH/UbiF family hydroxylase [Polynucleobacter sp.]
MGDNRGMDFDVVIVGGGLAGLAMAAALRRSAVSVALVEARPPVFAEAWDSRVYAVSPANARFLESLGVWSHLDRARMEPVRAMEIHGDAGGRLDLTAYGSGVSELAWIVESALMQRELWETVKRQGNLSLLCPASPQGISFAPDAARLTLEDGRCLVARLIIAADGADSWTRAAAGIAVRFDPYDQLGVVANFETDQAHRGVAFQWFGKEGVLAWLPLPGNRISIVWSTSDGHGRELLALDPAALCGRVAEAGGERLGELKLITAPRGFPLRLMRAPQCVAPRLALIGDAAHTIHPLSGHGINLGFQDARVLSEVLCEKPGHVDCGDLWLLRSYERARKEEVVTLQAVTDSLHDLFQPAGARLTRLRNFGLNLTNTLPVVKDLLVRYALAS